MNDQVDLLQIKIEEARKRLPKETLEAIDSVNWKVAILGLRADKGYTFEQLGDLEIETELLLAGMISPAEYPKEIQNRMKVPETEANEIVEKLNELVFKKIQAELIKNSERKKATPPARPRSDSENKSEIPEKPKEKEVAPTNSTEEGSGEKKPHPILAQKLAGSFKLGSTKTEHSLDSITKKEVPPTSYPPKADPYREIPE